MFGAGSTATGSAGATAEGITLKQTEADPSKLIPNTGKRIRLSIAKILQFSVRVPTKQTFGFICVAKPARLRQFHGDFVDGCCATIRMDGGQLKSGESDE